MGRLAYISQTPKQGSSFYILHALILREQVHERWQLTTTSMISSKHYRDRGHRHIIRRQARRICTAGSRILTKVTGERMGTDGGRTGPDIPSAWMARFWRKHISGYVTDNILQIILLRRFSVSNNMTVKSRFLPLPSPVFFPLLASKRCWWIYRYCGRRNAAGDIQDARYHTTENGFSVHYIVGFLRTLTGSTPMNIVLFLRLTFTFLINYRIWFSAIFIAL